MGIGPQHRQLVMTVHCVPALTDNYIWLFEYQDGLAAVVDPAESGPVLHAAGKIGLSITHILNTHWHPDHVGGNLAIKEATGATIIGPAGEAERIPGIDIAVAAHDRIALGPHDGEVLFVGAHTAGHIAWHFASAGILFPGDTLFAMGCGRLFEGSAQDMYNALSRLKRLPQETLVYCAHEYTLSNARFAVSVEPGNLALQARFQSVQEARRNNRPTVPFTIGDELRTNPFIRAASAEELGDRRKAKDVFS